MRGALIVTGSLLWDKSPEKTNWRNKHLDVQNRKDIKLPLRYGRISGNLGVGYTPIITPCLSYFKLRMGRAHIIPFNSNSQSTGTNPESDLTTLMFEARELARAEGLLSGRHSDTDRSPLLVKDPTAIGLLNLHDNVIINNRWKNEFEVDFRNKRLGGNIKSFLQNFENDLWLPEKVGSSSFFTENFCVNKNLLFSEYDINDMKQKFDYVLMLVTRPGVSEIEKLNEQFNLSSEGNFPTLESVAHLFDKRRYGDRKDYFRHNRRNGIHTADDGEISKWFSNDDL